MKKFSLLIGIALLAHPVAILAQDSASATSTTTTTTSDQKTYTEDEIRASVRPPNSGGAVVDVRKVGTANNSTNDRPATKSGSSSSSTPTPTPTPVPVPPPK